VVFSEDETKEATSVGASGEGAQALPSGWTQHWSAEHNRPYYAHTVTQQVTWERPTLALEKVREEPLQHQKDETAEPEGHSVGAFEWGPALAGENSKTNPLETLKKETEEKIKAIETLKEETEEKLRKETGEMAQAKEELKRTRKAVAETKAMHRAMVGKIKKVKANAKSMARKIAKGDLGN
jgi:hypothetical protein